VFTKTASGVPFDGNGNVIGLVNAADGTLAAEYEYTPTGVVIKAIGVAANACPLGFMTRYTDSETGLVCDHHRYLDVVNDRFLNHDPIEELTVLIHSAWMEERLSSIPVGKALCGVIQPQDSSQMHRSSRLLQAAIVS